MGKHRFKKPEPLHIQGICQECGIRPQSRWQVRNGIPLYRARCRTCSNVYGQPYGAKAYRKHKKTYCESCGFIAKHQCQLDVDHADGNPNNNEIENLRTLCANCHRLKTYLAGDTLRRWNLQSPVQEAMRMALGLKSEIKDES